MKSRELFKRFLGRSHLPCSAEFVLDVVDHVKQRIEDFVENPAWATQDLRARADFAEELLRTGRIRATESTVRTGFFLLHTKDMSGGEWKSFLASLHMSARTAQNMMALALFSVRWPELYAQLKSLGPSKLYRIARLSEKQVAQVGLETEVDLPRGVVKLRHLSDRELKEFLRRQFPDRPRRLWTRAAARARLLPRLIDNAASRESVAQNELEEIIACAREALGRAEAIKNCREGATTRRRGLA